MSLNTRVPAKDLTREYPRSPRALLAGYVIAARMLDKCRATIAGTAGEYHFNCLLDRKFLDFAQIDPDAFRNFVATGASDEEVAVWIEKHAKSRPRIEVIKWNNQMRELKLSDLPDEAQEYMEGYIQEFVPAGRVIYRWWDVYDIEEKRLLPGCTTTFGTAAVRGAWRQENLCGQPIQTARTPGE